MVEQPREHILACLSSAPSNAKIIRTAATMVRAFHCRFTALFVQTPSHERASRSDRDRLRENIALARSLGAVRMSQDVLSGRLAIYHGSDADFAGLRQLAETCEAAAAAGDLYGRITADRDFHLRITELGQNELLLRYQREVYLRIHLLQLQYVSLEDDAAGRAACHSALVDALCRRDEAAYTRAICRRCQEMYGLDPQIVSLYTR